METKEPNITNIFIRTFVVAIVSFLVIFQQTGRFEQGTFLFWWIIVLLAVGSTAYGINNISSLLIGIGFIFVEVYGVYISIPEINLSILIAYTILFISTIIFINLIFEKENK